MNDTKPSLAVQAPTDLGYNKASPLTSATNEQCQAAEQHTSL